MQGGEIPVGFPFQIFFKFLGNSVVIHIVKDVENILEKIGEQWDK